MRRLLIRHKIKQLLKNCIGYCSKCKSKNACKRMQEGARMDGFTNQRSGVMYRKDGETVTLETKDFEGMLDQLDGLKTEKEYWKREAIRSAGELGEIKIKLGGFIENNSQKDTAGRDRVDSDRN